MKLSPVFPANILPVRSGVYQTMNIDPETGDASDVWKYSLYDSTDKIWGCSASTPSAAASAPDFEFAHQVKRWRGIQEPA